MSDYIERMRRARDEIEKQNPVRQSQSHPMSYGQIFTTALQNTPRSAKQFVDDTLAPFLEPGETAETLLSLGKGLIQLAIPGEQADEKTAKAVGQFYANRYGSIEQFKRAFAEDPVGILGDISVLVTGGGTAAARAPGAIGKIGNVVKEVGEAIDPLNIGIQSAALTGRVAGDAVSSGLGMTTGAGKESVSEAFLAGRAGGERQQRFTDSMRGVEEPGAIVDDAMSALRNMRTERGAKFGAGKQALQLEKIPVDMDRVASQFTRLADSFVYEGVSELSPKGQMKLAELQKIIGQWQKSPGLHTAKGLDILKRRIDNAYPTGINPGDEAMIAKRTRDIVMDEIREQAPDYTKVMKPYEEAIRLEREIQKALSLNKQAAADTSLRKLQSVMRNNVNANFGERLNLVNKLEAAGDYYLLPRLAGQALNSPTPRGLQGLGATGVGVGGLANPAMLAALPTMSPRLVGEAAVAAGAGMRNIDPVLEQVRSPMNFAQKALMPYASQIQAGAMGSRLTGQTARAGDEDELTAVQRMMLSGQ